MPGTREVLKNLIGIGLCRHQLPVIGRELGSKIVELINQGMSCWAFHEVIEQLSNFLILNPILTCIGQNLQADLLQFSVSVLTQQFSKCFLSSSGIPSRNEPE